MSAVAWILLGLIPGLLAGAWAADNRRAIPVGVNNVTPRSLVSAARSDDRPI